MTPDDRFCRSCGRSTIPDARATHEDQSQTPYAPAVTPQRETNSNRFINKKVAAVAAGVASLMAVIGGLLFATHTNSVPVGAAALGPTPDHYRITTTPLGAGISPGSVVVSADSKTAFLQTYGTISNGAFPTFVESVSLTGAPNINVLDASPSNIPSTLALDSRSGSLLYGAYASGSVSLTIGTVDTGKVSKRIPLGGSGVSYSRVAIDADRQVTYLLTVGADSSTKGFCVNCTETVKGQSTVYMIDTRSGTLLKQVPIGGHPTAISVDQANHDLFTFDDGILTETSPDLGKSSHYNAPKASTGGVVAVDSNTHIVYVLAGDTLTSINPRANTSAEIRLPSRATLSDLAIDSRLHRAHVISSNGDQQLFFVNTDTNSLIGSTTVGFGPGGADISVDQSTHTVYIAKTDNNNGSSGDINGQLLAIEWANGTTSVGPGPAVVLGPTASATKTTPPETAVPTRGASPTTAEEATHPS